LRRGSWPARAEVPRGRAGLRTDVEGPGAEVDVAPGEAEGPRWAASRRRSAARTRCERVGLGHRHEALSHVRSPGPDGVAARPQVRLGHLSKWVWRQA